MGQDHWKREEEGGEGGFFLFVFLGKRVSRALKWALFS